MRRVALFAAALAFVFVGMGPAIGARVQWPVGDGGNGHFYEAVGVSGGISWSEANDAATAVGGYLATVTSDEENQFIFALINKSQYWSDDMGGGRQYGPWLGGFQPPGSPEPDGNWQWVTGEPFVYSNWYPTEPNEYLSRNEDRIGYWRQGQVNGFGPEWNDAPGEANDGYGRPTAYVIETVPEPSTVVLLLSGTVGLLLLGAVGSKGQWRQRGSGVKGAVASNA